MSTHSHYLARYPLAASGHDLNEQIILRGSHSECLQEFDRRVATRRPEEPMLQVWFIANGQVECMATTNQPFDLETDWILADLASL